MLGLRTIARIWLRFALPVLLLQVVVLAPLPDAFGINYDLASLKKPVAYDPAKCPVSEAALDYVPMASTGFDNLPAALAGIASIEHKKQKLQRKKVENSDEGDDPIPIFLIATPEDLLHNSSPRPTVPFSYSHNMTNFQSWNAGKKTYRENCGSIVGSSLTSRLLPNPKIPWAPACRLPVKKSQLTLMDQYFELFQVMTRRANDV